MPSFLRGLFEEKAAPKNAVPRAVSNSRGGLYTGVVPNTQSWDIDQALTHAYERVIWVYRCVDAIASNSSSVPMIVREHDDVDGMVIEDPAINQLLNRRPNIYETAQQFRYRVASQALLSRRGVFIEVVRDRSGRPKELHLLPNSTTTPVPDAQKFVAGYTVQTVTQGIVELEPEQVIWIRIKPHPTDVYAQMTPLVSSGLAADTDFLARLYNRNFLANDGRPGMLIAVQGQLMQEDAEEIRRRFSGGPSAAGQTTVIEAEGLSATDMSANPRDVQWQEAVRGSKEDILLAFGVPESVLGNASGRTFDNADAEFEIFWTTTMKPFMDGMGAGYDILTSGGLEDNLYVAHDYSTVDVLQRQERRRHEKAMGEFSNGLLTIDEYLEAVGREKFDVPGSRVLWLPQGKVPVGRSEEDTQAAAGLMPVGMAGPPSPEEAARQGALQGAQEGIGNLFNIQAARALELAGKADKQSVPLESSTETLPEIESKDEAADVESKEDDIVIEFKEMRHPYESARAAVEAEFAGILASWSRRQERTVIERIGGVKARKHTRHWEGEPGTKALDAVYIVNPEQWAEDLADDMEDLIRAIGEKEALRAARELNRAGIIDRLLDERGGARGRTPLDRLLSSAGLTRYSALETALNAALDMIRESALRQSQKVIDKITEMDANGASVDEIKKAVRELIGSRSSWRKGLSIAATTSVMEGARSAVYEQGGKYVKKVWRTMRDEKVRPTHRRAYGQKRSTKRPFNVGGYPMMYPGDLTAPVEETANCRCWVELEIQEVN